MEHEKIPLTVDKSWHKYLQPLFDDKKMNLLRDQILPAAKFYPPADRIFRVFSMPIDKIKVVILGQDPYHKEGQAIGFSFAVSRHIPIPPSLLVVKNEVKRCGVERDSHANIDLDIWQELVHWKNQGVFLLNTGLTVEANNPNSHTQYWRWFTFKVVEIISKEIAPIWMLWGSPAKEAKAYMVNGRVVKTPDDLMPKEAKINYVLEAYHPAAETRPDSIYKFTGCNHFYICNKVLKHKGQTIINW